MRDWWDSSPSIGRREVMLVAIAAIAISVVQFLPLISNLGDQIPLDLGDPLSQSWQVAWGGHALLTQPLAFWQSNQFWPQTDTLAYSDALVGYAPTALIGSGPFAAIVRYDLLFLFAFAFAFVGAYLLARETGLPWWAASVGASAFAFAPFRLEQGGHLHVISSGGIALSLFFLLRGYRRGSGGLVLAGWLVAAWQCSLGFALGLQLDYLLVVLAAIGAVAWFRSGRPKPAKGVIWASAGGVIVWGLVSTWLARPYLRVLDAHPEAKRTIDVLYAFSPSPKAFFNAPFTNLLWGSALSPGHGHWYGNAEKTLFPGLVIALLAMIGLFWRKWPRTLKAGLAVSVVGLAVLSLGVHARGIGHWLPYRFVYEYLPGWEGIRTPGRLQTLTSLALALLAAAGAAAVGQAVAKKSSKLPAALIGGLLAVIVLIEGSGFVYPHPQVPKAPAALAKVSGPMLELPFNPSANRRYLLWSTDGFPKMVNGRTSFEPTLAGRVARVSKNFPDPASIALLRSLGVHSLVLHMDLAPHTVTAQIAKRTIPPGSGVTRARRGDLVVFTIPPTR